MRRSRSRGLAWGLGGAGALLCCVSAAVVLWVGAPKSFLLIYVVGVLMGLLGPLVAAREPGNSIGWLMCATSLVASLVQLPAGYAYFALVVEHGAWPLGPFALWLGTWSWVPVVVFLPLISVRFPDGKLPRRGRAVDWIAIAGAATLALAIVLAPRAVELDLMAFPSPRIDQMQAFFSSPVSGLLRGGHFLVQSVGLAGIVVGYLASAAAVAGRFRRAEGDERLQLKWFAYAGAIVAVAFAYGAVAWTFVGQPLYLALTPLEVAIVAFPLAIAVAILRYRLYDIDLLINRTLVYAGLTAILGALYAAAVTFLNRVFISVSGQKSDAAYVVTAFAVAVAFGPVKDWLQRQVDRRVGRGDAAQRLEQFREGVDGVVAVIDIERLTHHLLDSAVAAFNARWAALYLESSAGPVYTRGDVNGSSGIEVTLRHDGREVGRLVMGGRRGDAEYGERDRLALHRCADSVAEAIALADRLGHLHVPAATR